MSAGQTQIVCVLRNWWYTNLSFNRGGMHNEGVPLHSDVMPIFGRRAMLLNAENSGIPAAT